MPEVTIPLIRAREATIGLQRADNALDLMNGSEVITEFAKAAWIYSFALPLQTQEKGMAWAGPLARLSRISNYFRAGPPGYTGATYNATTLQVDGANQLGFSLNIKNAQNNTLVLRAGEYFELNDELKIVVEDCTSNSSGLAVLQFEPPLRASPANNANLNTQTPKAKFRLASPRADWTVQLKKYHSISISCIEVI